MEDSLVKKIIGAISGFKNGTKQPKEVQVLLDKLKEVNPELAKDYHEKYVAAARERNKKA